MLKKRYLLWGIIFILSIFCSVMITIKIMDKKDQHRVENNIDYKVEDKYDVKDNTINSSIISDEQDFLNKSEHICSILQNDFSDFKNAYNNHNINKVEIYAKSIVENCRQLKDLTAPEKFKQIQQNVSEACDIYIDIYKKVYYKININDNEWLDNYFNVKEHQANNLMKEAIEKTLDLQ